MWTLAIPIWEFVLRGAVVYIFLLVILRLTGKRQVGQLATFDLVLLLVLSNAVQNSMNGGDNSLVGGLISAVTLVTINHFVGIATSRSKRLEAYIEGHPEILVHNGKVYPHIMARAKLSRHELDVALRAAGCVYIKDVHVAILENNGSITVLRNHPRGSAQAVNTDADSR
ncbi:DUF421 domain-containing protein [Synechococcus sp. Tobar12-5m-g]|jgi:uncharacterized membrane protein YcaP (DUF421 family)|uniref:DUF421 domain-containing protein n=1 Tax=unclassified Synechococcus TaxID=2626047 RepID=UPI0020CCDD43|nr:MULTISPECIES: YetF domain-containing protein [unclassified Synechococcus]MCP9773917.1 DUF421 domain-containing protein [Synechococcus sp. Tobar12-5m-g]MCP9874906.1 DUF421 domain-containing protein [Synechococcus sp. Cruz CV-v-12]